MFTSFYCTSTVLHELQDAAATRREISEIPAVLAAAAEVEQGKAGSIYICVFLHLCICVFVYLCICVFAYWCILTFLQFWPQRRLSKARQVTWHLVTRHMCFQSFTYHVTKYGVYSYVSHILYCDYDKLSCGVIYHIMISKHKLLTVTKRML